jgi:hypothetical protein
MLYSKMNETDFSGKSSPFALEAISSSLLLLDERGEMLTTNSPWREFGRANGGLSLYPRGEVRLTTTLPFAIVRQEQVPRVAAHPRES